MGCAMQVIYAVQRKSARVVNDPWFSFAFFIEYTVAVMYERECSRQHSVSEFRTMEYPLPDDDTMFACVECHRVCKIERPGLSPL